MTEAEWLACDKPEEMTVVLGRKVSKRKNRLFACACCYRVGHLVRSEQSTAAVVAAEQYADRLISARDLEAIQFAAYYAIDATLPGSDYHARRACSCAAQSHAGKAVNAWQYAVFARQAQSVEANEIAPTHPAFDSIRRDAQREESVQQAALLRDVFANPFRRVEFSPDWRTDTALTLARQMYESRDFSAMPILADALQDAGCDNDDILNHCRDLNQVHVRGCWVVDLILGKE